MGSINSQPRSLNSSWVQPKGSLVGDQKEESEIKVFIPLNPCLLGCSGPHASLSKASSNLLGVHVVFIFPFLRNFT